MQRYKDISMTPNVTRKFYKVLWFNKLRQSNNVTMSFNTDQVNHESLTVNHYSSFGLHCGTNKKAQNCHSSESKLSLLRVCRVALAVDKAKAQNPFKIDFNFSLFIIHFSHSGSLPPRAPRRGPLYIQR